MGSRVAVCGGCGKPLRSDNRYGYCHRPDQPECVRLYQNEYNRVNPESNRRRSAAWQRANRTQRAVQQMRHRAKRDGIPFDLSVADLTALKVDTCPVFGAPIMHGSDKATPWSPSWDRIIPERGYVRGNVQMLSNKANIMKSNATPEELMQFAQWVTATYGEVQ